LGGVCFSLCFFGASVRLMCFVDVGWVFLYLGLAVFFVGCFWFGFVGGWGCVLFGGVVWWLSY